MSDTANGNAVATRLSPRKLAIATLPRLRTSGDMDRLDGEVRASGGAPPERPAPMAEVITAAPSEHSCA